MIRCRICNGEFPGTTTADWISHDAAKHQAKPTTPQQWEKEAELRILIAARSGVPFLVADVLKPLGEHPEPDRRQFVNGTITSGIARDGWICYAPDGAAQSTKAATKSSLVRRWVGTEKATGRTVAA